MAAKHRTQPRTDAQICEGIQVVKAHARDDLKVIHLIPCDWNEVWLHPGRFNAVKERDGTLRTVFKGKMIRLVMVK